MATGAGRGAVRRYLVVANQTLGSDELVEVQERLDIGPSQNEHQRREYRPNSSARR